MANLSPVRFPSWNLDESIRSPVDNKNGLVVFQRDTENQGGEEGQCAASAGASNANAILPVSGSTSTFGNVSSLILKLQSGLGWAFEQVMKLFMIKTSGTVEQQVSTDAQGRQMQQ